MRGAFFLFAALFLSATYVEFAHTRDGSNDGEYLCHDDAQMGWHCQEGQYRGSGLAFGR